MKKLVMKLFEELCEDAARRPDEGCNVRAIRLARAMRESGDKEVRIALITGRDKHLGNLLLSKASPWEFHYVCMSGNMIYDPSAGAPLDKDEYIRYMFPQQTVEFTDCTDSVIDETIDPKDMNFEGFKKT